jgi:hypothetical protein
MLVRSKAAFALGILGLAGWLAAGAALAAPPEDGGTKAHACCSQDGKDAADCKEGGCCKGESACQGKDCCSGACTHDGKCAESCCSGDGCCSGHAHGSKEGGCCGKGGHAHGEKADGAAKKGCC